MIAPDPNPWLRRHRPGPAAPEVTRPSARPRRTLWQAYKWFRVVLIVWTIAVAATLAWALVQAPDELSTYLWAAAAIGVGVWFWRWCLTKPITP